jgi:hypothetical protein
VRPDKRPNPVRADAVGVPPIGVPAAASAPDGHAGYATSSSTGVASSTGASFTRDHTR